MDNFFIPKRFGSSISLGGELAPGVPGGFRYLAEPTTVNWVDGVVVHPDKIDVIYYGTTPLHVIARAVDRMPRCSWTRDVYRDGKPVKERVTVYARKVYRLYFKHAGSFIEYSHMISKRPPTIELVNPKG